MRINYHKIKIKIRRILKSTVVLLSNTDLLSRSSVAFTSNLSNLLELDVAHHRQSNGIIQHHTTNFKLKLQEPLERQIHN